MFGDLEIFCDQKTKVDILGLLGIMKHNVCSGS